MSAWEDRLIAIRCDVLRDVGRVVFETEQTSSWLDQALSVEEAETILSLYKGDGQVERLAWRVVGCVHRNFLSAKKDIMAWSMARGAHPQMRSGKYGTLLHECNDASLVDFLIDDMGVDKNAVNDEGKTALYCAMRYGAWDVAEQLIKHQVCLFPEECPLTKQAQKENCAELAVLLCCEHYKTNPSFALTVWRFLRPLFDWDNLSKSHQNFLCDLAKLYLSPLSWINEVLESLSCFKRVSFTSKEKQIFLAGQLVEASYYVSTEEGLRVLFSSFPDLPSVAKKGRDNILYHGFQHFCFPLVRRTLSEHPYLLQDCLLQDDEHAPIACIPHARAPSLHATFCPDLLLLGYLEAMEKHKNDPPNAKFFNNAPPWQSFDPRKYSSMSEQISARAYNILLSHALKKHIYSFLPNDAHLETETRKM